MMDRVALNFLNFKHSMKRYKSPMPEFVDLTTDGETFNLFFRGYRSLIDWFNHGTASSTLAGLLLLRDAAKMMVSFMK